MTRIIKILSVVNFTQLSVLRWGAMFLVIMVAGIVSAGVFFRYVLNDSLSWSEELAKYAMLWLVFLAAPIALRLGVHPNISIFVGRLPHMAGRVIPVIVHLMVFVFCAYLTVKSHDFAWNGRRQVAISVGDISLYWFFLSIPVGMASMALVSLQQCLEDLHTLMGKKPMEKDMFVAKYRPVLDEF